MDFQTLVFFFLSAILIFASLRVITSRNPVHAALHLILAFFTCGGIWALLQAEFLAIAIILVYVGAVMVLFLFVVMMLDINTDTLREGFWKHAPVAGAVGLIIALEMAAVLIPGFNLPSAPTPDAADLKLGNTKMLGIEIYTEYLYPLQIAAVLLLVAIIAAIALTLRQRKDTKQTNPSDQVRAKKADRVRLVKMQPTVERDAPSTTAGEPS